MTHRTVRRVLFGAGWCALVVAAVGVALYAGRWQLRELVLLTAGATYLMLGALVALLLFLAVRGWRSAVAAGIVLAAVLWTQVPLFVPDGRAAAGTGTELTIVQSNLLFGKADTAAVVAAVREQRVDVLTLDELTPAAVRELAADGIAELLPHHYLEPGPGGSGTGIYSRFPLTDRVQHDEFTLRNLSATLRHPVAGPISVFAFHPLPPTADHVVWAREMRAVGDILDSSASPAVVGADFNATSNHTALRALVRGDFAAAAEQAGAGRLPTYPADTSWGPLIGIDHILLSGGSAGQVRTFTVPGSDHRALLARVRLTGRGPA